jgi:hypothetical protein
VGLLPIGPHLVRVLTPRDPAGGGGNGQRHLSLEEWQALADEHLPGVRQLTTNDVIASILTLGKQEQSQHESSP